MVAVTQISFYLKVMLDIESVEKPIRFRFSAEKAHAAIRWMLDEAAEMDLHGLLKACYFADKAHLNSFGRPVFGATYRAMRFGPVPLEIYEMLKGEPVWLAELGIERFPWRLHGYRVTAEDNAPTDLAALSESDRDALRDGLRLSLSMDFNARTAATHGPDWQDANLGLMRYEAMIDDSPDKAELVSYLREAGPFLRL